jgi:hypothetical protein
MGYQTETNKFFPVCSKGIVKFDKENSTNPD